MLKRAHVVTGMNDNQYDLECYALTQWACEALLKQRYNVLIERTLEYIDDLQKLVSLCRSNGYKTLHIIDIDAPLSICLGNLSAARKSGPLVPMAAAHKCFCSVRKNRSAVIAYLGGLCDVNTVYERYENTNAGGAFMLKERVVTMGR